MENNQEIKELKERLSIVENILQRKSKQSNVLKFVIGFAFVFAILWIAIGVIRFVTLT